VFKAHRLLHHSTIGLIVTKKKKNLHNQRLGFTFLDGISLVSDVPICRFKKLRKLSCQRRSWSRI